MLQNELEDVELELQALQKLEDQARAAKEKLDKRKLMA